MAGYESYKELAQHESEGADYVISAREGSSSIAVIAPHGGGIEPGTADIADAVAADHHAFAAFKGIKKSGNRALHIRSDRFDDFPGAGIAERCRKVITIHGCRGQEERIYVGGRSHKVKMRIIDALNRAGFHAEESLKPALQGRSRRNICNRCLSGRGVQVEISKGLREKMFKNLLKHPTREKTETFYCFVRTVKASLDEYVRRNSGEIRRITAPAPFPEHPNL